MRDRRVKVTRDFVRSRVSVSVSVSAIVTHESLMQILARRLCANDFHARVKCHFSFMRFGFA